MNCDKCPLNGGRVVDGDGPADARFILIGEAPGANEERTGIPFIGKAGAELQEYLDLAGIDRDDCYITNIVKCRPPNNRTPHKKEIACCGDTLMEELQENPSAILIPLGGPATKVITGRKLGEVHGCRIHVEIDGIMRTVVPMFHPAAGFYKAKVRGESVEDWSNFPHEDLPYEKGDYGILHHNGVRRLWSLEGDVVAVDTETRGGRLVCSAWCTEAGVADAVVAPDGVLPTMERYVMHNYKFDLPLLHEGGMRIPPEKCVDTMIGAYALGYPQIGLHRLSSQVLGMDLRHWNEAEDDKDLALICASHADATMRLWEAFEPRLPDYFWEIDMPVSRVLIGMEDRGVKVNREAVYKYGDELEAELASYSFPFNPDSPQQVGKHFYEELGFVPTRFTDSGAPSTDKLALEVIDHPDALALLGYKKASKSYGTYVTNYIERMDAEDRIHPQYRQTRQPAQENTPDKEEGTGTRRLSCVQPNLQNVSSKADPSGRMRKLFIPEQGHEWLKVDYSQLELRVFAAIWKAKSMLEVFMNPDGDIHEETRLGCGFPDTKDGRTNAKIMNFQMLYIGDMNSAIAKAHELFGWDWGVCRDVVKSYYRKYPEILDYWEEIATTALEEKGIATYFGYWRRLPQMYSSKRADLEAAKRSAINTPVQGTAADIVKIGMITVGAEAPMVVQVHDEMNFDIEKGQVNEFAQWLYEELPGVVTINDVQFPVEVKTGPSWGELTTVKEGV